MAIKHAPAGESAQQAMETLTAQWYNAVVTGCGLDRSTFQLFQGNGAIGSTSENLWNIFDVVPPASVSNFYNPSQANVFSSDYGAVINNLVPQNSQSFQNDMGDYYARWQAYLQTGPTIPSGGFLQLFQNWSLLNMPPDQAQQCYTDYQEVSQGAVPVAVQMWINAGGAGAQKAYNATINQLQSALSGVSGKNVSLNSATESSDTAVLVLADGRIGSPLTPGAVRIRALITQILSAEGLGPLPTAAGHGHGIRSPAANFRLPARAEFDTHMAPGDSLPLWHLGTRESWPTIL